MYHPKTIAWDSQLKAMFDRIDHELEDAYGGRWTLRRNRPERGATSNPEADGLFNVGTFFTPGYGSELGRGYLVEVILATDEAVPAAQRNEIEERVRDLLLDYLPEYFPDRRLSVDRDGSMYKIHGETSLGRL
ncbi:MAG TPA: hypothetical protein PLQ29_03365 [Spirochaetales bacterium]|nr:hypothetical protein [Spirochaetales bacterium]HPG85716.1 hypothetical protein [Spirochaetales bacterium]HPM73697.1 hypothetical protein [Spirochaetales bacterium]